MKPPKPGEEFDAKNGKKKDNKKGKKGDQEDKEKEAEQKKLEEKKANEPPKFDPTSVWRVNTDGFATGYIPPPVRYDSLQKHVPDIFNYRSKIQNFNSAYDNMQYNLRKQLVTDYLHNLKNQLNSSPKKHPYLSQDFQFKGLERAIDYVYMRRHIVISFDIEAYEFDNRYITEVALSIYDPSNQSMSSLPYIKQVHIIVNEFTEKVNHKFLPDNKNNFLGGRSLVMNALECTKFLQQLINYYYYELPSLVPNLDGCIFVGHGPSGDLKWFSIMGVKLPTGAQLLDTQKFWHLSHGKYGCSLSRILRYMDMPHSHMHNAGNDCYYTLLLALQLADPQVRMIKRLDEWNSLMKETERKPTAKEKEAKQKEKKARQEAKKAGLFDEDSDDFNFEPLREGERKEKEEEET
ncbi:unnamed protein product [Ambrosiozyma monospora]|uniref:Unnamed protein product n=1 Tax=Ambrosiozyma monospora TaxID=43982 RepID=A0ACB5TYD8_AMBMO|nr:unnamed protein product [Ambrosiozyma monospora]